jgi:hypothetical protein
MVLKWASRNIIWRSELDSTGSNKSERNIVLWTLWWTVTYNKSRTFLNQMNNHQLLNYSWYIMVGP